ncbi:2-succinyl-5-enolpyruvyl-6-hydroxy-3-cyclohexene-1-carboxylic-acid synthase [Flavobacteriaceae bacterium]|nr:2-succinyl-5-enolpyruvyl-6-hydroxy-3-cyclohexene-1-carboxylic-acid synthase [Flavobacteriaceae bacterium]
MEYSRLILSHLVVQHCQAAGIESVVISPGSRNAPLVMDFTAYHGFKCYSIIDERSAGFFALGLAQQSRCPVALVCTSGSALVNYFPAITEAYYSQLPLVVISADRPEQLIDRGEGQTINQKNIFGSHVLGSVNLSDQESNLNQASNQLKRVFEKAASVMGPIHINVPMDEPLYAVAHEPVDFDFDLLSKDQDLIEQPTQESELNKVRQEYHSAAKKMILIGALPPNTIAKAVVEHWRRDPSIIVLTETLANVHDSEFISGIDQVITDFPMNRIQEFKPDLLISLGGMIVSKRIKKLLRAMGIQCHWHIGNERPNDTFFALKEHINLAPNQFFSTVMEFSAQVESGITPFKMTWLSLKAARLNGHKSFVDRAPFSDFSVHHTILEHLPNHINLQLANSASIRYTQLFAANPTHAIYCNRGTSGIEGSMSTAIGAAISAEDTQNRATVFITGDLSFFYDINALWQKYTPNSLRIIVVNNQGGGIFRILPGAKEIKPFETFLETTHSRNASLMASEFGFEYFDAHNLNALKSILESFFNPSNAPRILEVFTPSTLNDQVLNEYFDTLKVNAGTAASQF